jgi:hypothetical protein
MNCFDSPLSSSDCRRKLVQLRIGLIRSDSSSQSITRAGKLTASRFRCRLRSIEDSLSLLPLSIGKTQVAGKEIQSAAGSTGSTASTSSALSRRLSYRRHS